jgi:photosystem II stability/assembly factor-like uncharacterized protein
MIRKVTGLLFIICLVPVLLLGATDGKKYTDPIPAHPDTSAPDAWGYTYVKSTDPGGPTFNWVDISTRGTLVTGLTDDNVVGPFVMPFSFPYYWYVPTRFKIGSNGYLTWDMSNTAFAPAFAACPSTSAPSDLMAICVGDLVFSGQTGAAGQCYYWSNGVDSLVVSFINVTEWEQAIVPANTHTFQIVLSKNDSSIVYQYGPQRGRYNTTNNTRLCIGMENATGQIGVNYVYSTTPPHALMPDSGLAIKFKRTVNTGLQITDAGIVGGLNSTNLAKMIRVGVADTVRCVVKNFGTAALTNAPVRYAISRTGQTTVYDTVVVPSMAAGQEVTVTFPRLFTPAVVGPYTALFNITVPSDVGPGNNSKTAELTSVNFGGVGTRVQLAHESGTASGNTSWIGGGGFGVAFDLPESVYPVRIDTVYISIASITAQPMTVQILDGSTGVPGAVLAQRTNVTAVVGWNAISFGSDSVRIPSGRFFVGATGQLNFNYELTAPISFRTWEYTGGWAPYRTGDLQDILIRATVTREATASFGWAAQTSGITTYLYSVKAVSSEIAWAAGASGVVRRTTDGGTTWTSVGGGRIGTADIYNIDAIDANMAFVTTSPAATYIFRTTNGGTLWDTVYTQAGGFIDAIKMIDATNGIAVGDPVGGKWTIARTTNGGASWARIATEPNQIGTEAGTQNGLATYGAGNIWFNSGVGGRIYRSTDAGATWTTGIVPFAATSNVWFNNALAGIATGSTANGVARTVDGGATWTNTTVSGTGFLIACSGYGMNDFFFARGTTIYRSQDVGANWTTSYTGTGSYVGLSFVKQGQVATGWAVTSTGGIAKYSTTLTDVIDHGTEGIAHEFALMQNYPNPFNPTTSIQYALPRASHVRVTIYNLLGQEVATLKNEVEMAGTQSVKWLGVNKSGANVASGVYFYRLEAKPVDGSAEFNSFRKMLLLK